MTSKVSNFSRRSFLRVTAGLAAGSVLAAACAPAPAAEQDGGGAPATEALTVDWWSHTYKPWNDELTRQKDVYVEENPDVQIVYTIYPGEELTTKFTTALQAGTGPDIMGAHSWMTPNLIAGNHVVEAPDWAVEDIRERFFPVAVDGATFQGKIYAYNQHIGGRQMIANIGLLEENGASAPSSWEDMVALIDVIDNEEGGMLRQAVANYGYIDEDLFASWGSILLSHGGQILTEDLSSVAFNNDVGVEAAEMWVKFVHPEMGAASEVFLLGQTAIMEAGPWYRASIENNAPDMQFQALPVLNGPAGQIQCDYVWSWLVNSASSGDVQDTSFRFTQWLNSVDNQVSMYKASSLIPTTFEALEHPDIANEEWASTFVGELENKVQYVAKISNWLELDKAMSDEFSLLATGAQSVGDTLANAEEAVNALLVEAEFYG